MKSKKGTVYFYSNFNWPIHPRCIRNNNICYTIVLQLGRLKAVKTQHLPDLLIYDGYISPIYVRFTAYCRLGLMSDLMQVGKLAKI